MKISREMQMVSIDTKCHPRQEEPGKGTVLLTAKYTPEFCFVFTLLHKKIQIELMHLFSSSATSVVISNQLPNMFKDLTSHVTVFLK